MVLVAGPPFLGMLRHVTPWAPAHSQHTIRNMDMKTQRDLNPNTTLDRRGRKTRRAGHSGEKELHVFDTPILHCVSTIDPEWRHTMISQAAYYLSERRGFERGLELEDWLAAEKTIDAELTAGHTPVPQDI